MLSASIRSVNHTQWPSIHAHMHTGARWSAPTMHTQTLKHAHINFNCPTLMGAYLFPPPFSPLISCYVRFDIVRRILQDYFHLPVVQVLGMTDVDDKILAKAAAEGSHPGTVASRYESLFAADMARLGVLPPFATARVSEYIPEIIAFVKQLESRGFAYKSSADGSVYFDTAALPSYGALARGGEVQQMEDVSREMKVKKRASDFALWKASKPMESVGWNSPWGKGRPGWHIECSAMASHVFGSQLDIHTGGVDLRFPHHNNEIAQCVAHHGCDRWGRYFMHAGHVHVEGQKNVQISEELYFHRRLSVIRQHDAAGAPL
eukprot:Opistho-2@75008